MSKDFILKIFLDGTRKLLPFQILCHYFYFVMRDIVPKRDGEWRRLHNGEVHSLYRSSNIVRVIKSRRLRWAGHVARREEGRSAFKILDCLKSSLYFHFTG